MPVTTRSTLRVMTDPNPDPTGADTTTADQAQTATATTPPSPLDHLLGHFETLLSHIQNSTPTTYSSRPGPNMEAGRNDSGGRLRYSQGRRASPIVRASSPGKPGDDVSHSPEFPSPDTARPTVSSTSMLDPGLSALSSFGQNLHRNSTPSSPTSTHANPHPPSSPMTSKITFKINEMDRTKDDFKLLAPGDDP